MARSYVRGKADVALHVATSVRRTAVSLGLAFLLFACAGAGGSGGGSVGEGGDGGGLALEGGAAGSGTNNGGGASADASSGGGLEGGSTGVPDAGAGGGGTTHPECVSFAGVYCGCLGSVAAPDCVATITSECDDGFDVCPTGYEAYTACVVSEHCASGWVDACKLDTSQC
jgi:hypothetical protein